jgi:AraC-like DNA-binding protein
VVDYDIISIETAMGERLDRRIIGCFFKRRESVGKKHKEKVEFRYYEIPQNEPLLALMGEKWKQNYGRDIDYLHFHNLMEIGYCYYGEGELVLEKEAHRFSGGMFSIIPKNILHTTTSDLNNIAYWEYLFIDVEQNLLDFYKEDSMFAGYLQKRINKKAYFMKAQDHPGAAALIEQILTEMKEKKEFYLENVKILLLSLFLEIARLNPEKSHSVKPSATSGTQIARALDFVSVHYNQQLCIEELAEECHMSETHFRRLFDESMNMTPVEYINLVRIQMACNFILKSNDSMSAIAEKVGYQTPSTFNRNFRRVVGVSPYQWKKNSEDYEGKLLNFKISALKGW